MALFEDGLAVADLPEAWNVNRPPDRTRHRQSPDTAPYLHFLETKFGELHSLK
jgi:hypothetical protein